MGKAGRPSKGMTLSKHNIELAIKSTQSMGQAALYMNVAKNTFKKYAKLHGLWNPKKSSAGIRKTGNVGSQLKHDLKAILEGKNPNPYREDTLLSKGIREGYIACKCSNCGADFSHIDTATRQDRKSTRLNSSHGYITYAVFCLKKKTERNEDESLYLVTNANLAGATARSNQDQRVDKRTTLGTIPKHNNITYSGCFSPVLVSTRIT